MINSLRQLYAAYRDTGEWSDGIYRGTWSDFGSYGVLLRLSNKQVERLPEGLRTRRVKYVYYCGNDYEPGLRTADEYRDGTCKPDRLYVPMPFDITLEVITKEAPDNGGGIFGITGMNRFSGYWKYYLSEIIVENDGEQDNV